MGCGGSTSASNDRAADKPHYNDETGEDNNTRRSDNNYKPTYDDSVYDGAEDEDGDDNIEVENDNVYDDNHGRNNLADTDDHNREEEIRPVPIPDKKPDKELIENNRQSSLYKPTTVGTYEAYLDFRHSGEPFEDESRPIIPPGELYLDEEFPLHVAIKESSKGDIEWKRPSEFCENPVLFSEGTTRFDIGQGSAGTCWFLSMVANISERPELLDRVVPRDAYRINTDQYDGVFHSKFWRFGQWDNVYTDDYLPVVYGDQIWGAKSATDKNEMWVALLEKSFGRLYGSYNEIYGGQPGDAYLALTGGVVERIDFEDNKIQPIKLFQRVKNALQSGSLVSCVVPDEYHEVMGLVGGHAYSLNGTAVARTNSGVTVNLLRVRNPWGHTEWNGAWSDESSEWQQLPPGMVENPVKDDGEFWVSLDDFLQYFSQVTVCSLTPDVDCDGSGDCLNHVMCIYGDWTGETAAGFQKRTTNPRYVFTVSDEGVTSDGVVPLVVQVIQRTVHRKSDKFSIRCDLYQVSGEKMSSNPCYVFEMIGGEETNVYSPEVQSTHRHHIRPGKYVVIPSTIEAGQEKEYLIRIFSVSPLEDIREVSRKAIVMACDQDKALEHNGQEFTLGVYKTIFGEWSQRAKNSGGQISHRDTFATNPQFYFNIPQTGQNEPVVFHLMQEPNQNKMAVGLRVFPYNGSSEIPIDIDYIYDMYEKCPANTEGSQGSFIITLDLDAKYVLPAGEYIAVIHMDKPKDERKYSLVIKSQIDLSIVSYQAGE